MGRPPTAIKPHLCRAATHMCAITLAAGSVAPLKLTVLRRRGERLQQRRNGLSDAARMPRRAAHRRGVSSQRAHCEDDDSGDYDGKGDSQRGFSHAYCALLNRGDLVNRDRLTFPLNRTGVNGRDVEIVRFAVLCQNDYMIAPFQYRPRCNSLLHNRRVYSHGLQCRASDKADN
jgi:hypothetical protein